METSLFETLQSIINERAALPSEMLRVKQEHADGTLSTIPESLDLTIAPMDTIAHN